MEGIAVICIFYRTVKACQRIFIKKLLKLLMCYKNVCFSKITFGRLNSVVDKNHKMATSMYLYMVTEIAKGFIILNTHMKLTSPWSEDPHNMCLFCTIWQCQQLQKIYQPTNQPTTVSLETAPNPMSKTLLYFSRMKCPITYKKNCCLEFTTIC